MKQEQKYFQRLVFLLQLSQELAMKYFDGDILRSDCYAKIKMESNCFNASSSDIQELMSETLLNRQINLTLTVLIHSPNQIT